MTETASRSPFLLCHSVTGVDYETYPFFCETTWDPAKGNHCAERGCRQYNDMATIFLSSRENSILSLVGALPCLVLSCLVLSCLVVGALRSCPQPPVCVCFSLSLPSLPPGYCQSLSHAVNLTAALPVGYFCLSLCVMVCVC